VTIRNLTQKMLISIGLGILVVFVLSFSADAPRLLGVLERFEWGLLPLAIGLTLLNYVLRFMKWHYFLRVVGARDVPVRESALIFTAGLCMAITPGKVGELLKAYLLRVKRGVPVGTTAPVVLAERLTDGVAMLLLASGGLIIYGIGWEMLIPILGALVAVVVASQNPRFGDWLLSLAERVPFIAARVHHLEAALGSARVLFRGKSLVLAIGIGLVSWSGEAIAFYLVLTGLGIQPSPMLAVQAAFILSTATLVGAASMLPGGLAAAEGSLAGLLLLLRVTHDRPVAAAATLIIRFGTLWLGVVVGLIGLALVAGQLRDAEFPEVAPPRREGLVEQAAVPKARD
jgi:uncharacterized membrane protein YbhN (UPF0104 family)